MPLYLKPSEAPETFQAKTFCSITYQGGLQGNRQMHFKQGNRFDKVTTWCAGGCTVNNLSEPSIRDSENMHVGIHAQLENGILMLSVP
jgi:hypothetical protein